MKSVEDLYRLIKAWIEQQESDGCAGCMYEEGVEEWELPCCQCKRACKDYWRIKKV